MENLAYFITHSFSIGYKITSLRFAFSHKRRCLDHCSLFYFFRYSKKISLSGTEDSAMRFFSL